MEQLPMMEQNSQYAESEIFWIEVPAAPEHVARARGAVAEFLRHEAWGDEEAAALLLAVGEACNNAVNYGGCSQTEPRLVVSCMPLEGRRLQVDIRNQGDGFHPDLGEYGRLPDSDFATHGRGFGLMLALVDDVQVLSDGDNTIVRLTKSQNI